MNKLYVIVIVLLAVQLFYSRSAFSQKKEDVVYLTNGSIVRGQIQKDADTMNIKILSQDRNLWVFQRAEVQTVKTEKVNFGSFPTKGMIFKLDFEFMGGSDTYNNPILVGLQGVFSYQLSEHYSLGVATGLETYEQLITPLMIDARYYFGRKSTKTEHSQIFLHGQAGYGFVFSNKGEGAGDKLYKGGRSNAIGIGVRTALRGNLTFDISVGYRYQKLSSKWDRTSWGTGYYEDIYEYNRIFFKIGMTIF
jgi:sRNA-binding regulator protein Hfq